MIQRLLVILVVSAFALSANAQSVPRTVLVEEGTNWSCGPCAAYNPGLESFLNQHIGNVIHLAYHPDFPGADDPMYLNDPTDNGGRIAYYSINGVPSVSFDGTTPFNPGEVPLLESSFQSRASQGSPIAMSVTRQVNGTSVSVHIALHPVQNLSSYTRLYLRVAAAEEYVLGPGPNGEKRYMHAMRTMMPSYKGTLVKLTTQDTAFDFSYDLDPSYNAGNMYEIAFLQNDATKEILQATTNEPVFNLSVQNGDNWVMRSNTGPSTVHFSLNNQLRTTMDFSVTYIPTSPNVWPITINGISSSEAQKVSLNAGQASTLTVTATPGSGTYTSGIVQATCVNNGDTLVSSWPVKFIASGVKMAYIDVQPDSARSAPTIATMDALNFQYVPLNSIEAQAFGAWSPSQFPEVVVAGNKWCLSAADRQGITAYLNGGGHMFLHGGEIAWGLGDAASTPDQKDLTFMHTVLKVNYVKDSASSFIVHGVTGDAVSNAFVNSSINIDANDVDQPNQPDVITALTGAIPIFYYGAGTTQLGGIRWEKGNNRLVYLSFGLQNLGDQDRSAVTTAVFNWLRSAPAAVNSNSIPGQSLDPSYPNPFNSTTTFAYTLSKEETVRISVVDMRGNEVALIANGSEGAGQHSVTFTGTVPKGTYFIVMRTAEGSQMRPITRE